MRYNKNKNVYLKLLKGKLCTAEIENLLAPIQFSNWHSAYKSLARVANKYNLHHLLADLLPTLFQVLENSAYPERSLINFERFIEKTDNRNRFFQSFK
jgi:glutamine synthetase adenylyltransferase